jgi:prepilin-type N-terminal cleavage/methylation domain-containing protein
MSAEPAVFSKGVLIAKHTVSEVQSRLQAPLANARGSVLSHDRKGVVPAGNAAVFAKQRTKSLSRRFLPKRQGGFSLVELLIVVAIILILAAIAVPKLNQNRQLAQETAALREIQAINTAQTQYYSQFGRYAANLGELGPGTGTSGVGGPQAADLIPGELAKGAKSGYKFNMTGGPQGYQVTAVPEQFGSTGRRTFYTDQTMVVRQNWSAEPANATSPELK